MLKSCQRMWIDDRCWTWCFSCSVWQGRHCRPVSDFTFQPVRWLFLQVEMRSFLLFLDIRQSLWVHESFGYVLGAIFFCYSITVIAYVVLRSPLQMLSHFLSIHPWRLSRNLIFLKSFMWLIPVHMFIPASSHPIASFSSKIPISIQSLLSSFLTYLIQIDFKLNIKTQIFVLMLL